VTAPPPPPHRAPWPVRAIGAVLRHPLALALKRPLSNAAWWWRGRGLINPTLPASARTILFLCQGNICRSPFAAELARRLLAADHADIRCVSSGLRASQAPRSPQDAIDVAARYGIDLQPHRAADVTAAELAEADVIVVMEVAHLEALRRRAPDVVQRVHLLPLYEGDEAPRYGALERVNLLDPFGQGHAAFVHCYARIGAALRGFVRAVDRARRSDRR
jgi:protein-tyrosine-phosphatase